MENVTFKSKNMKRRPSKQNGFSLIEVIIASTVVSIISLTFAKMIYQQSNMIVAMENKMNKANMENDLRNIINTVSLCESAFKDNAANKTTYTPPANVNTPYSKDLNSLYFGDQPAFSMNSAYGTGLRISGMSLSRQVSIPVNTFEHTLLSGAAVNVSSHSAMLNVSAVEIGGPFAGRVKNITLPVNLFVNTGTNEIETCSSINKVNIARAVAERNGAALQDVGCETNPSLADYQDHPDYMNLSVPASKFTYGQASDAGTAAEYGRCPVNVLSNSTTEPNDAIFRLIDFDFGGPFRRNGIGCNKANGWFISGCLISNDGIGGDSDVSTQIEADAEYCITNDFGQPHIDPAVADYSNTWVKLTIICAKYQ